MGTLSWQHMYNSDVNKSHNKYMSDRAMYILDMVSINPVYVVILIVVVLTLERPVRHKLQLQLDSLTGGNHITCMFLPEIILQHEGFSICRLIMVISIMYSCYLHL